MTRRGATHEGVRWLPKCPAQPRVNTKTAWMSRDTVWMKSGYVWMAVNPGCFLRLAAALRAYPHTARTLLSNCALPLRFPRALAR